MIKNLLIYDLLTYTIVINVLLIHAMLIIYTVLIYTHQVSKHYAPVGKSLASITVVGSHRDVSDAEMEVAIRSQLKEWWGARIDAWKLLRIYR